MAATQATNNVSQLTQRNEHEHQQNHRSSSSNRRNLDRKRSSTWYRTRPLQLVRSSLKGTTIMKTNKSLTAAAAVVVNVVVLGAVLALFNAPAPTKAIEVAKVERIEITAKRVA
jgi:hypothetical protein